MKAYELGSEIETAAPCDMPISASRLLTEEMSSASFLYDIVRASGSDGIIIAVASDVLENNVDRVDIAWLMTGP